MTDPKKYTAPPLPNQQFTSQQGRLVAGATLSRQSVYINPDGLTSPVAQSPIVGPQGPTGPTGPVGPEGPQGPPGDIIISGTADLPIGVLTWNGLTGNVTFEEYVSSWNGQTGDVTFNDYVSSWNGQTGDVTYTSINESTGILFGGQMSGAVGGTTFSVAAGVGQIVGYTFGSGGVTATISQVTWDDYSGLTLANLTSSDFTRVYIDSNGDLQQQTAPFTHEDPLNKIVIGTISHIDRSTIALVTNKQLAAYDYPHKVYELYHAFGPIKSNGLVVSANGTNLSLDRSAGEALILGSNYTSSYEEPDGTDITAETLADIARIYRDGSGDFIYDTNSLSFYSVVDPGYYDDNSGILQVVNNNQYTIQRMYMFPNLQNVIMVYYGRVVYNSYSDALAGIQDEVFDEAPITSNNAIFLGNLIVRGGAADLSDPADGKIIQSGFCRAVPVGGGGAAGGGIVGDYVSSVNGQTGDVIISVGQGLTLNGTTFSELGWLRGGETFPETIGGIAAGSSFDTGTTAITILEQLLFPYQSVAFASFDIGISFGPYEVGQTAGAGSNNATWTTSGPSDNWVAGSLSISASGVGTLASGLNFDSSPTSIDHGAGYMFSTENTLTFTITGQQDQGSDPSRTDTMAWRYRYYSGRTGGGFNGTNLDSQGFTGILTRTSPNSWTVSFPAASPGNKLYFIIPQNEYGGTLTFTDTSNNLPFPFNAKSSFTHQNTHGLDVDYDIYESTNNIAGAVSVRVNT